MASVRGLLRSSRARLQDAGKPDDAVYCPVCGGSFRRFLPYRNRMNSRCPSCGSKERHRKQYLILQRGTDLFDSPGIRVLHFAPEDGLRKVLTDLPGVEYLTADLLDPRADVQIDITRASQPDDSFDAIICSHVMEHVREDRAAIAEIHRMVRPGGWALMEVPVKAGLTETYEDWSITSPEGREKAFGQWDHVRLYADTDFRTKVAEAGWTVLWDNTDGFSEAEIARHGMRVEGSTALLCRKD